MNRFIFIIYFFGRKTLLKERKKWSMLKTLGRILRKCNIIPGGVIILVSLVYLYIYWMAAASHQIQNNGGIQNSGRNICLQMQSGIRPAGRWDAGFKAESQGGCWIAGGLLDRRKLLIRLMLTNKRRWKFNKPWQPSAEVDASPQTVRTGAERRGRRQHCVRYFLFLHV